MNQKSTEKKMCEHYHVGEYLWRTTDNALFKITNVNLGMTDDDGSDYSSYDLTCVNHAPVKDVTVYLEMVHEQGSIYTTYQPSKPLKGQHVWNIFIDSVCHDKYRHDYHHDKHENEFIVESVVEKKEDPSDLDPCKKCHNGKCKQCNWGYRPKSEVLAEVSQSHRKKPETMITLMNLSGHKVQTITLEQFNASFTMLPPDIYEIDKFVREEIKSIRDNSLGCEESEEKAEKEVDDIMNDKLENESIDTGTTVENSYDAWRKNLKVVNVLKFDQEYFQRGLAYHVQKHGIDGDEFYGIMVSVDENILKVLKPGTRINLTFTTEIVEIPLKEYMDGLWRIVRLVEEGNK